MNPFGPFRVTSLLLLLTILVWHPDCISSQGWADEDDSEGMMNDVSSFVSVFLPLPLIPLCFLSLL